MKAFSFDLSQNYRNYAPNSNHGKSVAKKADSYLDFPNEFSTFFRILRKRLDLAVTMMLNVLYFSRGTMVASGPNPNDLRLVGTTSAFNFPMFSGTRLLIVSS